MNSSKAEQDDSRLTDTLIGMRGSDAGSIRVLHVDDEPDVGELVTVYLEREGDIEVVTETDAEAGLERIDSGDIDCVVSDYDMPGMDGLEFLQAVRDDYPDLPFILFTGKGNEEIASEAISAGVTDYLQKGTGTDQYAVLANRVENATRRYHAEKEMRRGFRAIETAREGIAFLDEDGRFVYVNRAYADVYGYDRDEMVGEHWEMLYPEEDVETVYDEILPAVPDKGRWTGESTHLRKDGTRLVVDHALAYTDEETLVCLIRDITEEKKRETEEDESDRQEDGVDVYLKERAMDEAPIGITISGHQEDDVPLIYANEGFSRITGYSEEETLGRNCRFLQGERTEEEPVRKMREVIEAGESVSVELLNYRKDGTEFWNEVLISPITDEEGDVTNFVGFQQDISERKRQERHLRRQLEQFERFSDVLSHDLGTPLSVAKGRLEMALEEFENEHVEKASCALDRVDRLVEGLAGVMREGELVNEIEDVSLEEAANRVWGTVSSGTDATLEAEDGLVRADEDALSRLLENLLRNAVEHGSTGNRTRSGDAVEHAGSDVNVKVGALPDGFYVEDDGPGIPPEERDEVFGFGYSEKDDEEHGIGLASVRQIAVAHGWEVSVTEGEEGGARFEVRDVETPEDE
ncbi:MAG: PAS domain S-box protein [Halobacteriales archaeon]|nr:PAS domain S-box protein [Halobacteriales archaeon]